MRGVSAIISIILIVMIVVALGGMTYTWFRGMVGSLSESAENATSTATNTLGMRAELEAVKYYSANKVNATIRNSGTVNINKSKIGAFVDGKYCPVYTPNSGILSPGAVETFSITNTTAACPNKVLKITVESGLESYRTIVC
jgi:FlaG/FlaF family flagellin (archaellin)